MTLADVAASGLYALVATAAGFAGHDARRYSMPAWHIRGWGVAVVLFVVLIAVRSLDVEEHIRAGLRTMLAMEGEYRQRSEIQMPLIAVALLGVLVAVLLAMRKWAKWPKARPDRQLFVAYAGMLGFIPLFTLRLISLHAMDALLYKGPLRLNWLLDGGFSLLVGGAAYFYVAELRRGARAGRDGGGKRRRR